MKKSLRNKLIIFAVLLSQLFYFSEILLPFSWGKMKVQGLACTCPDLKVLTGTLYLRSITPAHLSEFDINYSEIYITESSSSKFPPGLIVGSIFDPSIIKGKVVGKRQIEGEETWNLIIEVEEWRSLSSLKYNLVQMVFYIETLAFIFLLFRQKIKKNSNIGKEN